MAAVAAVRWLALLALGALLRAQRSQFDVDCPTSCRCNATAVECVRAGARGVGFLWTLRQEAYPRLDTVSITGNALGDVAAANIFGDGVTHPHVSLCNLSRNAITAFDERTLQGLPAVEFFYLDHNSLERVGNDPFRWNTRLRFLDISSIFGESTPLAERPSLLAKMFAASANRFVELQEVIARDNALTRITPDTFCKVEGLMRLHLGNNKLTSFPLKDGCLPNLKVLELAGNEIMSVPVHMWDLLPSLGTVDISSNPLRCDCDIAPFIERIAATSSAALNQGRTICASPEARRGRNALDITDFDCSTHHRLLFVALVLVLLSVVFVLFRTYQSRLRFIPLPFVAGYSKLGETEQVSPQFV